MREGGAAASVACRIPLFTLARGWWSMGEQLFSYSTRAGLVLRVILATLLVCGLTAAPAFAQDTDNPDGTDNAADNKANFVDCSQVQLVVVNQYNSGDAIAASLDGDAIASIAQYLDISQNQVNNCLINANGGMNPPDGTGPEGTTPEGTTPEGTVPEGTTMGGTPLEGTTMVPGDTDNPSGIVPGTKSGIPLPNTGGTIPLSGPALGIVIMAAGIVSAIAIVRRGR